MEGNLKMDLKEIGLEGVAWISLGQNRDKWQDLVNTAVNIHSSVKCWKILYHP
jgi:hypothetical protein